MTSLTQLPQFGFISITGRDAVKFLQGYTTCDVERMTPVQSRIGAICNIKGRMVASALIIRTEDGLLLRLSQDLIEPVKAFLQKYIVFSKAEMADLSDELNCLGIMGDCQSIFEPVPSAAGDVVAVEGGYLVRRDGNRCELWIRSDCSLPSADAGSLDDWLRADVEAGIAWVEAATADTFIPQMFDYHRTGGVDFDKGCYLGQEIVARMQYRGNVNRKLFRGKGAPVSVGDPIVSGEKNIGTVVAAAGEDFLAVIQSKDDDAIPAADGMTLEAISRD